MGRRGRYTTQKETFGGKVVEGVGGEGLSEGGWGGASSPGAARTARRACRPASPAAAARPRARAWMVKRSEIVNSGGLWLEGHGLLVGPEVLGLSPRVRRAAPSLQMQSVEPVVASCGVAMPAPLTILSRPRCEKAAPVAAAGACASSCDRSASACARQGRRVGGGEAHHPAEATADDLRSAFACARAYAYSSAGCIVHPPPRVRTCVARPCSARSSSLASRAARCPSALCHSNDRCGAALQYSRAEGTWVGPWPQQGPGLSQTLSPAVS